MIVLIVSVVGSGCNHAYIYIYMGYRVRDVGYGIRDVRYGVWSMEYGMGY